MPKDSIGRGVVSEAVSTVEHGRSANLGETMSAQHILAVVQSDLQYICSLRRILEVNGHPSVTVARNSQEAILYIRGVGIYQNRRHYPIPSLVILDCQNTDGVDLEVLAWIRERSPVAPIPLVLLCSEKHGHGHVTCALDPYSFIVERENFGDLLDALQNIETAGSPQAAVA